MFLFLIGLLLSQPQPPADTQPYRTDTLQHPTSVVSAGPVAVTIIERENSKPETHDKPGKTDPVQFLALVVAIFAAGAAATQAGVMWRTTRRQLRAYVNVSFKFYRLDMVGLPRPESKITIKNFGRTPAFQVRANIQSWQGPASPNEADPTALIDPTMHNPRILAPGEAWTLETPDRRTAFPYDPVGGPLYVYGTVTYRDAFGTDHKTRFCYFPDDEEPDKLRPASNGNEAT